jgi:Ca-activated chloride channel family protein
VPAAPPPLLEPGRAGGAAPPAAQAARPEKPKAPDPSKNRGASRPADAPVHDESDKQSAMSATPAVPGPAGSPSLQGGDSRVAMAGEDVPSTQREEGAKIPATEGVLAPEEAASFGYLDMGGAAEDRGVDGLGRFGSLTLEQTVRVHITVDDPGRIKRLCGPGADLPLEERRGLWRERLAKTAAQPGAVLGVYRTALALCEAPTVRERRALLLLGLDHLPTVTAKVGLYRLLSRDLGASDIVYRAILARVTTPAQMRELNQALGLVMVDSLTLEKTIKEAKDPRDLVEKLRALSTKYPADLALALRVIDALEDAGDDAAAREAARTLRQRSDADARVRTAVGELYLRLASRAEGAEQKESDQRDAKRAFGEIVEFSPEDPVARRRLGDLYRAHGFYEEATRQYETLARLVPDDPTVFILLAACAEGLGKLEEAVRWTEKAGQAGAPDATQGPHATARAFAAAFLAWGRQASRAANKPDEVKSLAARLDRVLGRSELERREGHVRVVLTWAHPEFHPTLWHSALGSPMPASEGDTTLGIAQAMLPDRAGGAVEVRVEPADLDLAARLGQKAILTVVFGEGKDAEVIDRREISFKKGGPTAIRFTVGGGKVEEAAR